MAYNKSSDKKSDTYAGYPSPLAPQKEKESPGYILKYIKAMYSEFFQDTIGYTERRRRFIVNRKYAEGLQSVDKYKDLIGANGDTSYLNLDYSIVPILPKFVDILINEMNNYDYKINCNALDPQSRTDKDKEKNKMYANMFMKGISAEMEQSTGSPIIDPNSFTPDSPEEAEVYMKMNFKQQTEIAMEEAIQFVMDNNGWKQTKREVIKDLVNCKRAALWPYFDENFDIRITYCDIINVYTARTLKDNFSDISHQAFLIEMPLYELRKMAGGELTDDDIKDIIENNMSKTSYRQAYGQGEYYHQQGAYHTQYSNNYDSWFVTCFYGWFKSTDKQVYRKKPNGKGGNYFDKKGQDYKIDPLTGEKEEVTEKEIQNVYQGLWIVGTDHIIKSGRMENMVRKREGKSYSPQAQLPIKIIAPGIKDMQNKSFTERIIPHADQIQLIHLKMQQLLAKARPPGAAINLDAIEEVWEGMGQGKTVNLKVQNIFDQTGTIYFRGRDSEGNPIMGSPITPLENGISKEFMSLIQLYNHELNIIRDVTGINEARDASTPNKDALVGLQKLALQSSNNATREIWDAFITLTEELVDHVSLMIQDKVKYGGGMEGFYKAIGEGDVKALELSEDISLPSYGFNIEASPTEEKRAKLDGWIQIALGNQTIDLEDAIEIEDIKNTKLAIQTLIIKRRKRMMEKSKAAAEDSQNNAQSQGMAAQVKGQMDMQKQEAKGQQDMALEDKQGEIQDGLNANQSVRTMEEDDNQSQNKIQEIHAASQGDLDEKSLGGGKREPKVMPTTK